MKPKQSDYGDFHLTFDDVLISPQYSEVKSRSDVDLGIKVGKVSLSLPVFSSNMDTVTGVSMAKKMSELGGVGLIHRYMSVKEQGGIISKWKKEDGVLALSLGTLKNDKVRIEDTLKLYNKSMELNSSNFMLCIDIAHGHSLHMIDTIKAIRDMGYEDTLIAGAVCRAEGVRDLLEAGADVAKVGVGGGSCCITRIKAGCGYPQFSAIHKCSEAGPIIADGGIRTPGDAAKAIGAGASTIMIGGMLAGTDFVPGWSEEKEKISIRGMASLAARSDFGQEAKNEEGISCEIEAKGKGSTEKTINDISEGIKSAMSYSGAHNIKEFHSKVDFIRVTTAAAVEGQPHILHK